MLSYFELPEDDRPPEQIWLDDEALKAHWDTIEDRRDAERRGESMVPDTELTSNELTAHFRK